MKYLSLCMATNGMSEWVFPVLDSIYEQDVDSDEFEVVVTDNGDNTEFSDKIITYAQRRSNLIYKKTSVILFENQIEALRLATGEYLKLINHRFLMEQGSIHWMLNIIKENRNEKPIMYMSNGALKYRTRQEYDNVDGFVRGLREYASWTTGVGVWKTDFEKIPENFVYNRISPHSDVLFAERHREKYIIDDKIWCYEMDSNHGKKGNYDLYKAFGCEEIAITLQLFIDGDISANTLKYVIRSYEKCLANFYLEFNILHKPCSYNIDSFNDVMGIFVSKKKVLIRAYSYVPWIIIRKIYNKFLNMIQKLHMTT